ncbi:hypothetical protein CJ430_30960, partial [Klebsiella pneumoniae]
MVEFTPKQEKAIEKALSEGKTCRKVSPRRLRGAGRRTSTDGPGGTVVVEFTPKQEKAIEKALSEGKTCRKVSPRRLRGA